MEVRGIFGIDGGGGRHACVYVCVFDKTHQTGHSKCTQFIASKLHFSKVDF